MGRIRVLRLKSPLKGFVRNPSYNCTLGTDGRDPIESKIPQPPNVPPIFVLSSLFGRQRNSATTVEFPLPVFHACFEVVPRHFRASVAHRPSAPQGITHKRAFINLSRGNDSTQCLGKKKKYLRVRKRVSVLFNTFTVEVGTHGCLCVNFRIKGL